MPGSLLALTAVVHASLALCVFLHARSRGRRAGRWVGLTLLFGVGGAVGYARVGH